MRSSLLAALLILPLASIAGVRSQELGSVDLELVLAADVSSSISEDEVTLQRAGYVAALRDPRVIRAIQSGPHGRIALAYVEWSGADLQETVLNWTLVSDAKSAEAVAAALASAAANHGGMTSISAAIEHCIALFGRSPFQAPRRVIDISGDGPNNSGPPLQEARAHAFELDITINGLPIVLDDVFLARSGKPLKNVDQYYEREVIGGMGAFITPAASFADLPDAIVSKMVLEIASGSRARRYALNDLSD